MTSLLRGVGFITGGASGIGKATASAFLNYGVKRLAIGDVNVTAVNAAAAELKEQFSGVEVLPLELDVTDEDSIDKAVAQTVEAFGRIDYAVNNAGISGPKTLSAETSTNEWQKLLNINLNGVWMSSRAEIRQMLKQESLQPDSKRHGRGVIINVASMYGIISTSLNIPACAYTAAKHAVVGLTKADAIAYAPQGIRINAICPGYVATPLLNSSRATPAMQNEIEKTPLKRLAEVEEISDAISFLASPMSSFMCGAGMVVDGGFTIQ